jgi:hypothetical protein
MSKVTSAVLVSVMLISNATLPAEQFQPFSRYLELPRDLTLSPPEPSWRERYLPDWINKKLDDAERRRLMKIQIECRASSVTEEQAAACYALKTGKY